MTREILFKAKRLDNGEWVKGSLISFADGGRSILPSESAVLYKKGESLFSTVNCLEVDPSTLCQYTGLNENAVKTLGGWADLASMAADMDGLTCTTVLDVLNTLLGAHIPDECVKQDAPVDLFYTLLETMATLRDIHRINYSELPEEERAVLLERNGLQGYSNQTHTWIGVEGFRATQAFHDILAHFLKPPELRK